MGDPPAGGLTMRRVATTAPAVIAVAYLAAASRLDSPLTDRFPLFWFAAGQRASGKDNAAFVLAVTICACGAALARSRRARVAWTGATAVAAMLRLLWLTSESRTVLGIAPRWQASVISWLLLASALVSLAAETRSRDAAQDGDSEVEPGVAEISSLTDASPHRARSRSTPPTGPPTS